jgi:4-amino-4-deoxy-L-arabinose transferase-like glycosyltransferase
MSQQTNNGAKLNDQRALQQPAPESHSRWRTILILSLIFAIALGVRLLNWSGRRNEVAAVQSSVVLNYKHQARLIQANGLASLYDASSSTNDPDLLGHPLGYPILLAFIYRLAPDSDALAQLFQITIDSLSTLLIALIAFELFPISVGTIAGLLAALAPQFSWNSMLLLPDSLAAMPILLAVLLLVKFFRQTDQRLLLVVTAGVLLGLSCWLRANSFLLAPFLALALPLICKRRKRLRPALVLVGTTLLTIAPLTVRNAVVFGEFIPVSLGAGQTLIEGIADYDPSGSLGLPQTDMALIRGEAETFQRPEYASSLFTPDGPARDRARVARGLAVIRAHPIWFTGVMLRRAVSMLKLERTPLRLAAAGSSGLLEGPLRLIQKLIITAIFLPLSLLGAAILIYRRQFKKLAVLLAVPCYYFCVQSALHTEYRYVLVIHYFLFVLAAVALYSTFCSVKQLFRTS